MSSPAAASPAAVSPTADMDDADFGDFPDDDDFQGFDDAGTAESTHPTSSLTQVLILID